MVNVKISDLSAAGALTAAELLELVQSGANVKVTLANLMKVIEALTAETAPATDDELALFDASAGATDKITLANLLKVVNELTEDSSPDAANDFLLAYDASASAAKKVKPANLNIGGLVLLSTATPSGASSADFDGLITGAYSMYLLVADLTVSADGAAIYLRSDSNGGASYDASASDYRYAMEGRHDGAATSSTNSTGAAQFQLTENAGSAVGNDGTAGECFHCEIWITPGSASRRPIFNATVNYLNASTSLRNMQGGGSRNAAAAIDSVQLLPSSGTITGVVKLYGLR